MPEAASPSATAFEQAPAAKHRQPLGLVLALAAVCTLLMIGLNEALHRSAQRALANIESARVLGASVRTLTHSLVEMEGSARGYILSGDTAYLPPYRAALAEVDHTLHRLPDTPSDLLQSAAWVRFYGALQQEMGELAFKLHVRQLGGPEAESLVNVTAESPPRLLGLREQAQTLASLADERVVQERARVDTLLALVRYGSMAGMALLLGGLLLYVRQARALRRSQANQHALLQRERDALDAQVRERTARLADLASYLQQVVEDERARLARELHDELGALLTAAKLHVARINSQLPPESEPLRQRLQGLTDTLNQGIALKCRIVEDLRPSSLTNLGLVAALEILLREFAEQSGLRVHSVLEPVALDAAGELTFYRLVQETLTNIAKHAKAQRVSVQLKDYAHFAQVQVQDDGVGFDPGAQAHAAHGLMGMRHRIEASGGQLDIQAWPGRGACLTASLPHPVAQPDAPAPLRLPVGHSAHAQPLNWPEMAPLERT